MSRGSMQLDWLWLAVTVLLLILLSVRYIDPFNAVPYNAFEIPKNQQDNLFQAETKRLDELFVSINRDVLPDYRNTFTKYPSYFRFKHSETFRKFLLNVINPVLKKDSYYTKSKFVFIRDIYNLYWNDDKNSTRHFIFNVDLNDPVKAFTRKLKVYLTVVNINKYLGDNGEFSDASIALEDIALQYIGTDNPLTYFTVAPKLGEILDERNLDNYYRTRNTLFLLDPFVTTGKEMRITDALKVKFDQTLKQKELEQKELAKKGFCFNSTTPTATTQSECVDAGGVWDYPPADNMECPFYIANQNYSNNFGGIRGEKCELPRNMQIVGYRNYSLNPEYLPLCYNCRNKRIDQGSLGYCCDEQNNKVVYPQLITPDYAFVGDSDSRRRFADIFAARGLSVD
ncbi:hypothetical protein EBU95_13165 [bacterium]|nr:hypothetical protein [bacterium]